MNQQQRKKAKKKNNGDIREKTIFKRKKTPGIFRELKIIAGYAPSITLKTIARLGIGLLNLKKIVHRSPNNKNQYTGSFKKFKCK